MISFAEARKYTLDSVAVSRIKPWWEVVIDILLIGLFIGVIMMYTQVNTSKIICVPLTGDASSFASAEAAYIVSRCSMESDAVYILLYPYVIFLEWGILLAFHISWIKFPGVSSKIDSYYNFINELKEVELTYTHDPNSLKFLPELSFSDKQYERLRVIYEKLMIVAVDECTIQSKYELKCRMFVIVVVLSILSSSLWVVRMAFLTTDFECNLIGGESTKEYSKFSCDMSTLLYVYGIIIYHFLILVGLLLFSIKAMVSTFRHRIAFLKGLDSLWEAEDEFKGFPGGLDFYFIISNIRRNTCDGGHMMEIIKAAFRVYSQMKDETKVLEPASKFMENTIVIEYIAHILGLSVLPNSQTSTQLFECFEQARYFLNYMPYEFTYNFKSEMLKEISDNALHFRFVVDEFFEYLDIPTPDYNRDECAQHEVKDLYTIFYRHMEKKESHGNHICLIAAANMMKIRIVVLVIPSVELNSLTKIEVFEPFNRGIPEETIFLTFTPPRYYHFAKPICNSYEARQTRTAYWSDSHARHQVKTRAMNHLTLCSTNSDTRMTENGIDSSDSLLEILGQSTKREKIGDTIEANTVLGTYARRLLNVANQSTTLFSRSFEEMYRS